MGCSSAYQLSPKSKPICTTKAQYSNWTSLMRLVRELDETGIYRLTGCMGACDVIQYRLTKPSQMEVRKPNVNGTTMLRMRFLTPTAHHKIHDQYYVFGADSLFADIGGYLGLLLGHSVFSIFCTLSDLAAYVKKLKF